VNATQRACATVPPVLEAGAVYLSPTGRACRWLMTTNPIDRPPEAYLAYARPDGGRAVSKFGEGFTLTQPNWRLLRRVA
jgi:hypothetical protein